MLNNATITPEVDGGLVPDNTGTLTDGGVPAGTGVQQVTPTQPGGDADWQAKFQEMETRYQRDINAQKSSLQRQMHEEQVRLQKEFETKLAEARLETMAPDQKAQYARQLEQRRVEEMKQQLQQYQQIATEQMEINTTKQWLETQGVPSVAIDVSNGLQGVSSSGWTWLVKENQRLKSLLGNGGNTSPVQSTTTQAPVTATGSPGTNNAKMTWDEIRTKYGSVDKAFELIEQRRLSPSILPDA